MKLDEFKQRFETSVTFRRQAIFSALKSVSDMGLIGSGAAFTPHNDLAFYALYLQFRGRANKHNANALYRTFLRPWLNHDGAGPVVMGDARQNLQPNPHAWDPVNAHADARVRLLTIHRTEVIDKIDRGDKIKQKWLKRPLLGSAVVKLSAVARNVSGLSNSYENAVRLMWQSQSSVPTWLAGGDVLIDGSKFQKVVAKSDVAGWLNPLGDLEIDSLGGFEIAYAGLTLM